MFHVEIDLNYVMSIHTSLVHTLYVCVCVFSVARAPVRPCMWRPEINIQRFPQQCSTLLPKKGYITEPETLIQLERLAREPCFHFPSAGIKAVLPCAQVLSRC